MISLSSTKVLIKKRWKKGGLGVERERRNGRKGREWNGRKKYYFLNSCPGKEIRE
jgi:hypothetical protein